MIKFNLFTNVERHKMKGFPKVMFRLRTFDELLSGVINDKELIDIIGRVVEIYPPKDKIIAGNPARLVDFLIEDTKDNRIKCTVWNGHVPAVEQFYNQPIDGPLVILLQLCRAKLVDNEVRISSSYNATKVLLNHDSKEVLEFKASLKVDQTPLPSMSGISMFSRGNIADHISKATMNITTTIVDLYDRFEERYYFIPARIVGLESGKNWYYDSSRTKGCYKKLEPKEGLMMCDTCDVHWVEESLKYRIVVRVMDKTSDAPFLLWDNECAELLGISANDLKKKYLQDTHLEIPPELESLRSKAMVFKVSVKTEHLKNPAKPIPVIRIVNDDDLVSTYCPTWADDQDQFSKMLNEEEQRK